MPPRKGPPREHLPKEPHMEEKTKIKQLTLRLPEDYHRKLKILAACSGKSMTEIIVACIDERLSQCLKKELEKI